ncbi:MAG TPA: hypothetical protein VL069_12385, partial [Opitutus sp.]|nr:hypothetical protein [Opitutus sp.]
SHEAERSALRTRVSSTPTAGPHPEKSSVPPPATQLASLSSPTEERTGEETEELPTESGLPESESTNVWPDETAEAAFLADTRGTPESVTPRREAPVNEEALATPLPKLDELINRIPAESRELLEELFRAKFTTVRRIKQSDLKI